MTKQTYWIKQNVQRSHSASQASRYGEKGLTDERVKLNSKNFDKLMAQRGLSKEQRASLKASMQKGSPVQIRHAKAGETFKTTHGSENSSGVFVSKESLGNTPQERIDKGALPHSNAATYETKVELVKDQNLVYGKIAPQPKFSKMDPKQAPRRGGAEQVITDGGYRSGAIVNHDPKYPVPAKTAFLQQASRHKESPSVKSAATANSNNAPKGKASGQAKGNGHTR